MRKWLWYHLVQKEDGAIRSGVLEVTAIVVALSAIGSLVLDRFHFFDPIPYRNVELLKIERLDDGNIHLLLQYIKTREQCEFERAVVFGYSLGDFRALDWLPYRGPGQTAQRTAGQQIMDITIYPGGVRYDEYEIRTRHDCEGVRVDRVMWRGAP